MQTLLIFRLSKYYESKEIKIKEELSNAESRGNGVQRKEDTESYVECVVDSETKKIQTKEARDKR